MSVYLPNVYRLAFNCDSVVPESVAKAKAEAYAKRTGKSVYIPGLGVIGGDGGGDPPADPDKTIGKLTVTGDDLSGTTIRWGNGTDTTLTASFDGDADDVRFKWSIRTGTSAVIKSGAEEATVTITGAETGDSGLLCTLSSNTATDSPQDKAFVCSVIA